MTEEISKKLVCAEPEVNIEKCTTTSSESEAKETNSLKVLSDGLFHLQDDNNMNKCNKDRTVASEEGDYSGAAYILEPFLTSFEYRNNCGRNAEGGNSESETDSCDEEPPAEITKYPDTNIDTDGSESPVEFCADGSVSYDYIRRSLIRRNKKRLKNLSLKKNNKNVNEEGIKQHNASVIVKNAVSLVSSDNGNMRTGKVAEAAPKVLAKVSQKSSTPFRSKAKSSGQKKSSKKNIDDCNCYWFECTEHIPTSMKLVEHLQIKHINPQIKNIKSQTCSEIKYTCLWVGCKVYGKASVSSTWLSKHVISHGGSKPYRCIIGKCGQRFATQELLNKHVNKHFNLKKKAMKRAANIASLGSQAIPRLSHSQSESRFFTDLNLAFNPDIMARMQLIMAKAEKNAEKLNIDIINNATFLNITFKASKVEGSEEIVDKGVRKILVQWYPPNVFEDELIPVDDLDKDIIVPLHKLPMKKQEPFWQAVLPNQRIITRHQCRKWKPPQPPAPQCEPEHPLVACHSSASDDANFNV